MVRGIACLTILGLLISVVAASAADSDKEMAAVSAAEKWLALIDEGKYAESWTEAATFFRNALPQNQWEQSLLATRKPFGKVLSRSVVAKNYATSLPGVPDGEVRGHTVRDLVRAQETSYRDRNPHDGQGWQVACLRLLHQVSNVRNHQSKECMRGARRSG